MWTLESFDHPVWLTAFGTAVGWAVMVAIVTILLFLIPLALWP